MASLFLSDEEELQICQQTTDFANAILHPVQQQLSDFTAIPVWTRNRYDLGEGLDYCTLGDESESVIDGAITACVVDADSGLRTYLDSEVIIFQIAARVKCGPGRTAYRNKKKEILQSYQLTLAAAQPVVVIIGSNFPSTTLQLPDQLRYVVLDHFRITTIWAEQRATTVEHMVRLEKCDLKLSSWWTPFQPDPPKSRDYSLLSKSATPFPVCQSCAIACPQVYAEAWVCLNEDCNFFWTQNDEVRSDPPDFVTFNLDLLRFRRHIDTPGRPSYALVPDLLTNIRALEGFGQVVSRLNILYRGIICPHCHNIVPKIYWHVWACTECQFKFEEVFNPGQIRLQALVPRNFTSFAGPPTLNKARWPEHITHQGPIHRDVYRIDKWNLHGGGQLIILSPSSIFNEHLDGPNSIYDNLLADANIGNANLQRYKNFQEGTLDSYFHSLFGAEYGFDPIHTTIPFGKALHSILNGMKLLRDAATAELRSKYHGSNSCELRAFLQGMKIRWHSDGGKELGDTVSTLVLGSDAVFRIRLQKYYWENTAALHPDGEVVVGAKNWQRVQEVRTKMLAGLPVTAPGYSYEASSDPVQRPEIVVPLIHGSTIILQGAAVRKYYEHMLDMTGPMGFTITTRLVNEDLRDQMDSSKRINRPHFFSSNERYTWDDSDDSALDSDVVVDDADEGDDDDEEDHDHHTSTTDKNNPKHASSRRYRDRTDPDPRGSRTTTTTHGRNRSRSPALVHNSTRPQESIPEPATVARDFTWTRFIWTAERLNTLLSLRNDQNLSWDEIRTITGWPQIDERLRRVERNERLRRINERDQQRRDAGSAPSAAAGGGGDNESNHNGTAVIGIPGRQRGINIGWTAQEEAQVDRLRGQNLSWAQVAARMGNGRSAAAYKARWLTLKRKEMEGTGATAGSAVQSSSIHTAMTSDPVVSVRGGRGGGGGVGRTATMPGRGSGKGGRGRGGKSRDSAGGG